MAERSEALEEQAVRDGSAFYSVEAEIEATVEVPPGYKRTDAGVIPKDWSVKVLGEVLTKRRLGGNYQNGNVPSGPPLMKMGNLDRGSFNTSKIEFIPSEEHIEEQHKLRYGDVLFNTRNTLELVGKVAIWRNELPVAYYNSNLMRLEFNRDSVVSNQYANYALNTEGSIERLGALATGTTSVAAIYTRDLLGLPFIVPPPAEQRAIAAALSDADAAIESLDRLIAKKRAIKQATMQQLLTGQTRLPGFTGEWETKRLGDVGKIVTGGTPPTLQKRFWGGTHPWVTPTDISSNREISESPRRLTEEGLKLIGELPPDTVLVTCIASIGKNVILQKRGGCNQQINAIIPDQAHCSEFIYYLIENNKSRLIERAGTTATSILSKANFATLEFTFPSIKEQTAIATVLSDMDTEIEALERRRDKARQIKQGMMQQLLTGRVRLVASQSTEPAAC